VYTLTLTNKMIRHASQSERTTTGNRDSDMQREIARDRQTDGQTTAINA